MPKLITNLSEINAEMQHLSGKSVKAASVKPSETKIECSACKGTGLLSRHGCNMCDGYGIICSNCGVLYNKGECVCDNIITEEATGQPILFLDFDGVLNSDDFFASDRFIKMPHSDTPESWAYHLDRDAVKLLNTLIENTKAKVIVSSAWRISLSLQELQETLNCAGFTGTVIGKTPRTFYVKRCYEIKKVVEYLKCRHFVVLDDMYEANIDKHFVQTNHYIGLTKIDIEKARHILER